MGADLDIWEDYVKVFSIPLVSGIIGWITNVVALHMTFYPLEFIGCCKPFLGWQGIIPSKAPKMAGKSVDLMTEQLIDTKEVFSRLDVDAVAEIMVPSLRPLVEEIVDEIAMERAPSLWKSMPRSVKNEIVNKAYEDTPGIIKGMMSGLKENIDEVFDLRGMVVDFFTNNKNVMVDMFKACGKEEFEFIRRSGFYFGFLFGLVQMGVWIAYDEWWILPLFGAIVGWATNFLAMKIIFNPVEPTPVCCGLFTLHGLFMKRQQQVSAVYGRLVARDVLNAEAVLTNMLANPTSSKLFEIVDAHVHAAIDTQTETLPMGKALIHIAVGQDEFVELKNRVSRKIMENMPKSMSLIHDYANTALDLETTLREKMSDLSYADFEDALHPVFQEDEWILILVGAVLGLLAGLAQIPMQGL